MSQNKKQFAIYEYEIFVAIDGRMDLTPNMVQNNLNDRQRIFADLFEGNKLNLYLSKEDGMPEMYDNYKWKGVENVFIYQINNNQNKTIIKPTGETKNGVPQFDGISEKSMPLGIVAIDNRRKDKGLIALEKNAGWGKTPEKLRDLLEQSFRHMLYDQGLDIKIEPKLRPTDFWGFTDEQCNKNGDSVTKVTIDFLHKNDKNPVNKKQRAAHLMKVIDNIGKKNGAIKSSFSMEFEEVNARKIKDMVHIAELCDKNEYDLSIYFKKFGLYRSKETVTAFYPMDEEVLNTFGWQYSATMEDTNHTYQLMTWFDDVLKKLIELENEAKTPGKLNRKNKK